MYQDRQISCKDCGVAFTFTTGEQEFFASKGLVNVPRRCPDCRRAAKDGQGGTSCEIYSAGAGHGGSYDRAPQMITETICAHCGTATHVPFAPRGDRAVYCSDCYAKMRGAAYSGTR